jgi:hypothetical protein
MEILKKRLLRIGLQFFADASADGGAEGEGTASEEGSRGVVDDEDVWMAEMEQKYGVVNGVASAQAIEAANAKRSVAHSGKVDTDFESESADGDGGTVDKSVNAGEKNGNTAEPNGEKTPEEEFDELIKSEKYSKLYTSKVAAAVNDRYKAQQDARVEADRYRAALGQLAAKYGKDPKDVDGIIAAMDADDSLLEGEAYRQGKTVGEIRGERKSAAEREANENEVAKLKAQIAEMESRERARADAAAWMEQSRETKKIYGDNFDLRTELKNPEFLKYLQRDGKTVTEAFEMTHYKEIMASHLKAVERKADINAAKTVAANRSRIQENAGAHRVAGESPRIDVRNMTDSDFEKIDEMLARGEEVTIDHFR